MMLFERKLLLAIFAGVLATTSARSLVAEELTPERTGQICQAVYQSLQRNHISAAPMPSDLGPAVIANYLRALDPRKMHFLQQDVDAFERQAKMLPRQLAQGDLSLMREVRRVYAVRVRQSHELAMRLVDQPLDFSIDESLDLNMRYQPYCVSVVEHHDRWRKWTKHELLAGRLPGETSDGRRARLKRRYERFLNSVIDADGEEQLEGFLTALAQAFDRHSAFLSPRTVESFNT